MIELIIVMAMIATILSIVLPRFFDGLARAKETALRENLKQMRDAIDHYHADKGIYPPTMDTLVVERYLRFIPVDPETESNQTWQIIEARDGDVRQGVADVMSGSTAMAKDGSLFSTW